MSVVAVRRTEPGARGGLDAVGAWMPWRGCNASDTSQRYGMAAARARNAEEVATRVAEELDASTVIGRVGRGRGDARSRRTCVFRLPETQRSPDLVQAPAPGRGEVAQRRRERGMIAPAGRPAAASVLDDVTSSRGLVGPHPDGPALVVEAHPECERSPCHVSLPGRCAGGRRAGLLPSRQGAEGA